MDKIDFVLTWVDGSDEKWLSEKEKYMKIEKNMYFKDGSVSRYRDWENLRYWFRGIENFAPWVNNIFFVTWGHIPKWLNTKNSKLRIIKHEDFIPHKYLPTFNINAIENNFHRIPGLSNNFVYFNDDMFLINPVKPTDFFSNDIKSYPMDSAVLTAHCYSKKETLVMTPIVDIGIINSHFELRKVLQENVGKWFSIKYGMGLFQNIILSHCPRFPGIVQHHLPTSLQKETYERLWDLEEKQLDLTCQNKFRSIIDVNQWVFREWQLASGNFKPRSTKIGKSFCIVYNEQEVYDYILHSKGKMICINDAEMSDEQFIRSKSNLKKIFDKILPQKSKFEL